MTDKPFLTIGEVADILQVSSRTVYNLIYKGTLRACRLTYHITIITKEDFFLMIRETTYCKQSVSIFARQGKKTKKKMNEDTPNTEKDLSQKEGKKKAKGSPKRQLIPAANYKQSVRDTFKDRESAGGDLYTMAEICQKFNYTYGRFYNLRMRYSIPCVKAIRCRGVTDWACPDIARYNYTLRFRSCGLSRGAGLCPVPLMALP